MPIFLLVRHGETDYVKKGRLAGRLPGVHLNETGRAQAQATAAKLTGAPVKAIYSSPLERTRETAETIAKALNLDVIPREGLMETEIGEWNGKTVKSLARLKAWKTVITAPAFARFPGGETFFNTQHRICSEIETLSSMHDPKDMIICVSHADPIKLVIAHFTGIPLDNFQRIDISPGSISVLQIGETNSRLHSMNYDPSFTFKQS
jgi:probable phosphomutase (TIGR03848 family)